MLNVDFVCTLSAVSPIYSIEHKHHLTLYYRPRFIQHFGFSYSEYVLLLETYNRRLDSSPQVDFETVACEWLHSSAPGTEDNKTIYDEKMINFPFQDKPELYIGGIFPITGQKYRAPELAKGATNFIYQFY